MSTDALPSEPGRVGPERSDSLSRPPWYLWAPAVFTAAGVLVPVLYLIVRASEAEAGGLSQIVLRWRNLELLSNTLLLCTAVLAVTTLVALPAAWLTTRSDLPLKRFFTVAMVMPLAVPGYLMAFTLLSVGGNYGALYHLTGLTVPRPHGFSGALIALGLYNFPYLLLNLRAAMLDMDPGQEEIARSLGQRPMRTFFTVVLPQLRPALLAGGLLVALHVVNDFGVVSLMRYDTLSFALYQRYENDFAGASWIALMLLATAGGLIVVEMLLLHGLRLHRAGVTVQRVQRPIAIGWWKGPAAAFLMLVLTASVLVPAATVAYWATQVEYDALLRSKVMAALIDSVFASVPAAVIAVALAAPVAYLARRYPSKRSLLCERMAFVGYAVPSLAFALGLVVVTLRFGGPLYQSVYVLVYAYGLHFLAEAVGPVRASLFRASPRVEEAARSLGHSPASAFFRVTLPLLRPGLTVALALVFLSCIKELPLTMLLAPPGFQTLATHIWHATDDARYADAAPFALLMLVISAVFVAALLSRERTS